MINRVARTNEAVWWLVTVYGWTPVDAAEAVNRYMGGHSRDAEDAVLVVCHELERGAVGSAA